MTLRGKFPAKLNLRSATLAADTLTTRPVRRFSWSSHTITSDLNIDDSQITSLSGAWHYRVSAKTGWPSVSILWLGEIESLISTAWQHIQLPKQIHPYQTLCIFLESKGTKTQQHQSTIAHCNPVPFLLLSRFCTCIYSTQDVSQDLLSKLQIHKEEHIHGPF